MGWDQDWIIPSLENLMEQLTGKIAMDLLQEHFNKYSGTRIVSVEKIILDEDLYSNVEGYKVTLTDGRVFIPKLVKEYTANGNYGCKSYEWKEINEKVKIKQVHEGYVKIGRRKNVKKTKSS